MSGPQKKNRSKWMILAFLPFWFLMSLLALDFTGCQKLTGRKEGPKMRAQEATAAYQLEELKIEDYSHGQLKKLEEDLAEQLFLFKGGIGHLQKVVRIYDGDEEMAYQEKMDKLQQEFSYLEENQQRLKSLSFSEWSKQKHFLQEQYYNLRTLYKNLYRELM